MLDICASKESLIVEVMRRPSRDVHGALEILKGKGLVCKRDESFDPLWALTHAMKAGELTLDMKEVEDEMRPSPAQVDIQKIIQADPNGKVAKDHAKFLEELRANREAFWKTQPARNRPRGGRG